LRTAVSRVTCGTGINTDPFFCVASVAGVVDTWWAATSCSSPPSSRSSSLPRVCSLRLSLTSTDDDSAAVNVDEQPSVIFPSILLLLPLPLFFCDGPLFVFAEWIGINTIVPPSHWWLHIGSEQNIFFSQVSFCGSFVSMLVHRCWFVVAVPLRSRARHHASQPTQSLQ